MLRFRALLVPSLVLVVAALRLLSNSASPVRFPSELPLAAIRSVAQKNQPSSTSGITRIEYQRFDPNAVIAVGPGLDQMPGIAGTDDNMNGEVDDHLELGATRSDDVCSVLTAEQLSRIPPGEVMLLQAGAFVASSKDSNSKDPERAFLFGISSGEQSWSVLVDLTDRQKPTHVYK